MTWSAANPPVRPGHYLNFKSKLAPSVLPSAAGTLFLPVVGDYGPFKTPVKVTSPGQAVGIFGDTWSPARIAWEQAFKGEAIPGFPGAGACIIYRFGGAAAAKATRTLSNTTPAVAMTLTPKYEGTRPNSWTVTVQTNAVNGSNKDLLLYEGTTLLESYVNYTATDVTGLVAAINAKSGWMTAAMSITGVALANIASAAFTTGNDGTTLIGSDWTAVMSAAASQDFAVYVPFDLTDTTIQAATYAWEKDLNQNKGKRFTVVVGGAANELIGPATTRSAAALDENIQTVGVGQFFDASLGAAGVSLSTSQLAPRYAGALAARGIYKDTTYMRFAGLAYDTSANSIPSDSDIITAIASGVLIIGADGHPLSPLRIEQGVTTFYTSTDPAKTVAVFGIPKFVMTQQQFERTMKLWAIVNVITPGLPINKDTREYVAGYAQQLLNSYIASGVLNTGAEASISQSPPPTDTDNFVNIDYSWTHTRSAQQVRGTAYVI